MVDTDAERVSRRALLTAAAALAIASTEACAEQPTVKSGQSKILVAYFTRSGNTKVIAGTLQRTLGADIFEIRPAQAYPEDYEQTVEQARQERDRGTEPPLADRVPDIASYDEIYLGFPIWSETAPPIIRSFLSAHDLGGKTLRPFITHGGFGLGKSTEILARNAPAAKIAEPFVMEADQERRTMTAVKGWLGEIKAV